jgi:hypothetical protein
VNGPTIVRFHVEPGEIPVTAAIYATNWPTSPCDLELISSGSNDGCAELVVSAALEHGRFVAIVAPTAGSGVACGTAYTAWLEALPAGACWIDEECAVRSAAVCAALGGTYSGAGQTCSWNCGSQKRGDVNCDDVVNTYDIDPFVLALVQGQDGWEATFGDTACDYFCVCDVNGDAAVNVFDIDPFVACIVAGGCGPE